MTRRLDFLGATGTVTGSRFLVSNEHSKMLVDAGLFQGLRELRRRNWDPFPVDPRGIDAVVLSHAHLDHSGYVPALVKNGFSRSVLGTAGTVKLAAIVLEDSAHLFTEDAADAARRGYSRHDPPLPLYVEADVDAAVRLFRTVDYETDVNVAPGMSVRLQSAGHILGSASVLVTLDNARSILFSGDLGRNSHPLLRPPAPPPAADVIIVESTYGDRRHPKVGAETFAAGIRRTLERGGSLVIPAFAVDRTEVILMTLRQLREAGAIPDVPVYVDSPMALAALAIYRDAVRAGSPDVRPELWGTGDVFDPGELHELRTVEQSKTLNNPAWPSIIVSASGMASGGRVLHHLAGLLPDPANTVVLAGYQALGTRGRQLQDGARVLKIHGRYVPVRAEVVDVPLFSVHADADETLEWLQQVATPPEICYIVHGEPEAARTLRDRVDRELGWVSVVPSLGERVRLD